MRVGATEAVAAASDGAVPSLQWLAALASLGAAGLHFAVAPEHFHQYWLFGWFFLVAAWLQALWAVAIATSRARPLAIAGALGNALLIAIWVWTRAVGVPVGPEAGAREALGFVDGVAVAFEVVAVALATALSLRRSSGVSSRTTPALAVALATLLVFALLGAVMVSGDLTAPSHANPQHQAGDATH